MKYDDLKRQMKNMHQLDEVTVLPIIITTNGLVHKYTKINIEKLNIKNPSAIIKKAQILASLGVFGLESYWILMKLRRKEKDCLSSTKYWQLLIDLQDPSNLWKKSVIYWLTSFLVFTKTKAAWLSQISGVQMIILSALYLLMCIQHQLKVHLLDVDKNRGPSKMMRQRCLSVFDQISMGLREGDEMEVFNTNEENLASDIEEEEEEEDPSLLKILSIDQDPMLIM
ncbi:hypothetical protein M8J77_013937 [Diaphorina citri]|nr:hypothetical protein M8J77_013937 [Diaphorina citri]